MQISYIIATFNRGPIMADCLRQTIANTPLPRDQYEILIVDNASTDGTPDMLARELGQQITLIRLPNNQGPVAKNHALARARGEIAILLDDDAFPLPGAIAAMQKHFAANPTLGAAVFDVQLPDGTRESSAYPDVFIGAGTGIRNALLKKTGLLPPEFFMQAEEYDLAFRILDAGMSVERFADMPLRHLKSPGARIAERTTRLDVRNNLFLLAKYIPAPLCHTLAADWLYRYWAMSLHRDRQSAANGGHPSLHRCAYLRGAAEGFSLWRHQRARSQRLKPATLEQIFKFHLIEQTLAGQLRQPHEKTILLADFGKNMFPFYQAIHNLGLIPVAIWDDNLAHPDPGITFSYHEIPVVTGANIADNFGAVILSNINPVQALRRREVIRQRWPEKKIVCINDFC